MISGLRKRTTSSDAEEDFFCGNLAGAPYQMKGNRGVTITLKKPERED